MTSKIFDYIKIILGSAMVAPLVFAFFRLDYSMGKSILFTFLLYFPLWGIGICGYNYIEGGKNK